MKSLNENRSIFMDKEAAITLAMLSSGIFYPITSLLGKKDSEEIDKIGEYQGKKVPFSFIFSPSGKRNEEVLRSAKNNELLYLVADGKKVGTIIANEVFKIDKEARIDKIYATTDQTHPGVKDTFKRLGNYAISGKIEIAMDAILQVKNLIKSKKSELGAKNISALMLAAKPLNRAHERLIRTTLEKSDLVVLFLLKPYNKDSIPYDLREKTLRYYVDNYLQKNRVIIVPLENTYIFAGYNNVIMDSIVAKNFGCTKLVIGENHAGLGRYHGEDGLRSSAYFIKSHRDDIDIETVSEFVYCDKCTTIVSRETCPHGGHHHISYTSDSIESLLISGILPPAVLVRKEISAMLMSALFPNRVSNIHKLYYDLIPGHGIVEDKTDEEFYLDLIKLYQTTSLS